MPRTLWIVTAVMAVVVLLWALVRPDEFYVEHVEFKGLVRATPAELRHLADVRNGTTMWEVDLPRMTAGIQRHPWVERVEVTRQFPGVLQIEVEERDVVALIAFEDGLYYVDERGIPFLRARSDDLNYPAITGLDRELEAQHPDLVRLAIVDALFVLNTLDAKDLVPRSQVSELSFHRTRGWTLRLTGSFGDHETAEVLMGFGDYARQLDRLAALVDRGVDLSDPLHVDLAPRTVAIVRPKHATAALQPR